MMLPDRGQSPGDQWYYQPLTDRSSAIGQQKIDQLQRQINNLEDDSHERQRLIQRLASMQEKEKEQKGLQDRVISRNSPVSRLLQEEIDRLYGAESVAAGNQSRTPVDRSVMEKVIQHRTKEFSHKQQEAALQAKYLDKERQRLQEARHRVQEQRRMLMSSVSPSGQGGSPKPKEVQGVDSYIKQTIDEMPTTLDKIFKMRTDLEQHYLFYRKPYNGELGIDSYEPWQIPDYAMCREIVNDVVDNFLNLYFKDVSVVEKGTYKAMLDEEEKWMSRQSEALSEKRAIQLISEELYLDETSNMITDVINEMYHLYGTFRNLTDGMLMEVAESVSTGQEGPRDQSDKTYDLVTKSYYTTKHNRNRHRKEVWGHSQYAQNKIRRRAIAKKKEGYVEEEEAEEEDDELDAPDLTVLDFNLLSPVPSRTLPISPIDAPEVSSDKEYFQRYARREIKYWSNIYPSLYHVDISKRCHGIRVVRPSPNHRFVAVCTYHGDIFILDALMKPWRPFRAMLNNARDHQYAVSIAWSLDSTRLVVINSVGILQVLSINAGSPNPDAAQKLGLKPDDKGMYAHQIRVLLELDVEKQDFIFHQGILAEEKALDDVGVSPVRGGFFPSLSFVGVQNEIVVAMDNGDVLKCNFQNILDENYKKAQGQKAPKGQTSKTTPATKSQSPQSPGNVNRKNSGQGQSENETEQSEGQSEGQGHGEDVTEIETTKIYNPILVSDTEASEVNTIGRGVEAELLRGHKKSILHMSFVENLNAMVTVDTKGNVNLWKYALKYKSSFGWFIPAKKYRVETNKTMFQEIGTDKPKVVFTDKTAPGKKPRTRQEIAAGRRRVQNTLDNMQLGDPWHEEYLQEEDMLVQVYAPRGHIPSSGAMFHIVYRHPETNLLSTYLTRLYGSLKIKCSRIVRVIGSPSGTALVFLLLYNKYPPKSAHITIFVLDLTVMELRDFRKDVPLSDAEYTTMLKKNIVSCDISRVYSSTGTDYLFIMFNGKVHGISLLTGQEIFRVDKVRGPLKVELDGCTLDRKDLPLPLDAECTCVGFEGKLSCLVYARRLNRLSRIEFDDRNQYAARRAMWKSYSILSDHKVVPTELRVNTFNWALDDIVHPAVAARKMLLKTLDTELRKAGHIRDPPSKIKLLGLSDKVEDYKALEKAVSHSGLLEKEGVLGHRQGGDGSDIEDFDDDGADNKF